ncbi:hypothetical protein GGF37_002328, partial [Kickxella alabastrina]
MDDAEVWPTERHHLSFDSPNTGMRRRRVFPNLAPPANPQVAPEESDSDSDQYFDSQALRLPPTPPRRRQAPAPTTDSDSEPEPELPTRPSWISSSPHREHVLGVSTYDFIEDQRLTRQTLERFGELRRQRFLRDQQLRAQLRDQSVLQSTVATNASVLAQLAAMDTNIVTQSAALDAEILARSAALDADIISRRQEIRRNLAATSDLVEERQPWMDNFISEESSDSFPRGQLRNSLRNSLITAPTAGSAVELEAEVFEHRRYIRRTRNALAEPTDDGRPRMHNLVSGESSGSFSRLQLGNSLTTVPTTVSTATSPALPARHFPSNDLDSYWYNQPEPATATAEATAAITDAAVPAAEEQDERQGSAASRTHRSIVPLRRLGHLPLISRRTVPEESRQAMLEVIRGHRTTNSGSNSESNSDLHLTPRPSWLSAAMNNTIQREQHQHQETSQREENPDLSIASFREEHHLRRIHARSEQQLMRWLMKSTVDTRALDCALLRPGMEFCGVQRITPVALPRFSMLPTFDGQSLPKIEQWDVCVIIQSVDMSRGRVSGLMKAINVPNLPKTVVTHWDGEIIDFVNYTPLTCKWKANGREDTDHWSLFEPVKQVPQTFLQKWPESMRGKRMPRILEDYLFMRWKESTFINVGPSETGLTIEGFYYICMDRITGAIE